MTFAEAYDYEFEPAESVDASEFSDEASRTRYRPRPIPGALSSATLNTPRGPATLNLPAPVATLAQFRTLEQTVNANTQRMNAMQAQLVRLNREIAARRRDQESQAMTMPLLLLLALRKAASPAGSGGGSSIGSILPFLLLSQPGFLGQSSSASSRDSGMGGFSPIMLLLLLDVL